MSLSMYEASIPVLVRALTQIGVVLEKAAAFAVAEERDEAELIAARLAPDMFALPRQVYVAGDMAKGCAARLAGMDAPVFVDPDETGFAELIQRVADTRAFVESVPREAIDGSEERPILIKLRDREFNFVGRTYLFEFVLPNVFFHSTAAYSILRHQGVPLTKQDYLGAM